MSNLCESQVDKIVENCFDLYGNLPKTGKPIKNEWTVLSCIVQYNSETKMYEVVSLGTGSKCIGAGKMSCQGNVINDSHAEVFARRGFLLYLYENIINAIENRKSIFVRDGHKFKLIDNIEFIFYSSQMPCGDASIISIARETDDFGEIVTSKREAERDICDVEIKKKKVDIHRTGAKCLSFNKQDPKETGEKYHLVGQVRVKPGRGDRTLSVSCSDKMARWIHVGIQGALLQLFLYKPIFIKYFIFGAGVPYSLETLYRAFLKRESDVSIENRLLVIPKFYKTSLVFSHIKIEQNLHPAAGSILWVKTEKRLLEVAVQGNKLGVTKKKMNDLNNCISICKYNLYRKFVDVLVKNKDLKHHIIGEECESNIPYNEMKKKAVQYQKTWSKIKEVFFKSWTLKPNIWNFCINKLQE